MEKFLFFRNYNYFCIMKKEIKSDVIFNKHYEGYREWFKFEDLPKDLLPTDKIRFEKTERFYSENESWDDYTELIVYRDREETDEEFEKRKLFWEKKKEESKKLRYESYLKLKKEFENEEQERQGD